MGCAKPEPSCSPRSRSSRERSSSLEGRRRAKVTGGTSPIPMQAPWFSSLGWWRQTSHTQNSSLHHSLSASSPRWQLSVFCCSPQWRQEEALQILWDGALRAGPCGDRALTLLQPALGSNNTSESKRARKKRWHVDGLC